MMRFRQAPRGSPIDREDLDGEALGDFCPAFLFSGRVYLEDAARVDAVTVKRCCTFWYSPSKRG